MTLKTVMVVLRIIVGLGVVLGASYYNVDSYYRESLAMSEWPTVPGTVLITTRVADDGINYVTVEFAYEARGIKYSNKQIIPTGPGPAKSNVISLLAGDTVTVYYDPVNPAKAVVDTEFRDWARMPETLISVLLLFGGIALAFLGIDWLETKLGIYIPLNEEM